MSDITVYTKFCLSCRWPKREIALREWANREGLSLKVKRTAYRPDWHNQAVELYGSADYQAFIVEGDSTVTDFISFTDNLKAKPVASGKKKGKKSDVQKRRASRSNRESGVAVEEVPATEEDETAEVEEATGEEE